MKTAIMLLIAVALGLVTAKIGFDLVMKQKKVAAPPGVKMEAVVVARHDLDAGAQIEPSDVTTVRWPIANVPKNAYTDLKDVVGRTVVQMVVANQPLLDGLMAPLGAPGGLQALVPEGMRAVTIQVNESSGVAGLLMPGARVDVISTLRDGKDLVAKTIVENVRVTAVGHHLVRDKRTDTSQNVRTVTLVMSPKNAEAVELASTFGLPHLVLRGTTDNSPTDSTGVTLSELVGASEHPNVVDPLSGPGPTPAPTPSDDAFGPPATKPSTKPSVAFQPEWIRHPVQIIRAGQESTIYYEVKNPKANGGSAVSDSLPGMNQ